VAVLDIQGNELITIGDKYSITGPTTGIIEDEIQKIVLNEKNVKKATQGELISFPCNERVRKGDEFYLMKNRVNNL
jgi:putative protease